MALVDESVKCSEVSILLEISNAIGWLTVRAASWRPAASKYIFFLGKVPGVKAVKPSSENPRWGSAR